MFKDTDDVDEGIWSEEERLLLAGGRDGLAAPPWCFMCPWEGTWITYCSSHSSELFALLPPFQKQRLADLKAVSWE